MSVVRVSRPTEKHTAHGELGRGQATVLASGTNLKGASKFVLSRCRRSARTPPPKRESAHVTRLCGKVGELEAPLMMDPRETTRTPACYGADSGTVILLVMCHTSTGIKWWGTQHLKSFNFKSFNFNLL